MSALECATVSELAEELHEDAMNAKAFQKGHNVMEDRTKKRENLFKKLKATVGQIFAANEERII